MVTAPKRSGRRRGEPDTKGQILASARKLFARDGLDRTPIRAIAADAGVDAALVHHYFGTKHKLFLAAVALPIDPLLVVGPMREVPIDELGETLVRTVVGIWDGEMQQAGIALLRTVIGGPDPTLIRTMVLEVILAEITQRVDHPRGTGPVRANLIGSAVLGMIMTRYFLRFEPLASMPAEAVVANLGPTLQRYLTGPVSAGE
jgi:AcrR family transcriptional regulator